MGAVLVAGVIASSPDCTLTQVLDHWEMAWLEAADAVSLEVGLRWAVRLSELETMLPSATGTPRGRDKIEADLRGANVDLLLAETDYGVRLAGARLRRLQLELDLAGKA